VESWLKRCDKGRESKLLPGLPVVASPTDCATHTSKEKKDNSHDNEDHADALKNSDFGE
jgi:hypothetical protein